jgi:hypothetical protein
LLLICPTIFAKTINPAVIPLECIFVINRFTNDYECVIERVEIVDDLSQEIIITGNHLDNKTNLDVDVFRIINSKVPFVITQAFFHFPNLQQYLSFTSGLKRIQSNALRNAPKLRNFFANGNPELTTIPSIAFSGGSFLSEIRLMSNSISDIHPNAFVGLTTFPANVFRPLLRLDSVNLSNNFLEVLHANLFTYNPRIHQLHFNNSTISAIDRNFLQQTPFVVFWQLQSNVCINSILSFGQQTNDEIQRNLDLCFRNFDQLRK